MAVYQRWQAIPTQLDVQEFEEFVLPHLSIGRRDATQKLKDDKILAFCDRHYRVIAPSVSAPNRNESPLLREVLPRQAQTVVNKQAAFTLPGNL